MQNTKVACAWWWISDTNLEGWNMPLSLFAMACTMCQKSCRASSQATCKGCICPEPSGLDSHHVSLTMCLPSASCSHLLGSGPEPLLCSPAGLIVQQAKGLQEVLPAKQDFFCSRYLEASNRRGLCKTVSKGSVSGCSCLNFWGIFASFHTGRLLCIWDKGRVLEQSSFKWGAG